MFSRLAQTNFVFLDVFFLIEARLVWFDNYVVVDLTFDFERFRMLEVGLGYKRIQKKHHLSSMFFRRHLRWSRSSDDAFGAAWLRQVQFNKMEIVARSSAATAKRGFCLKSI